MGIRNHIIYSRGRGIRELGIILFGGIHDYKESSLKT